MAATGYLLVVSNVQILYMMAPVIGVQTAVTMMRRLESAKTDVRKYEKNSKQVNKT